MYSLSQQNAAVHEYSHLPRARIVPTFMVGQRRDRPSQRCPVLAKRSHLL